MALRSAKVQCPDDSYTEIVCPECGVVTRHLAVGSRRSEGAPEPATPQRGVVEVVDCRNAVEL